MRRVLVLCLIGLVGAFAAVMMLRAPAPISLVGAKAFAMADRPAMLMVGLTIENAGPPDVLLDVASPGAGMIMLANPGHSGAPLVVPGQGQAVLAMDGAHAMLRAEGFDEGGFIPLTLTFETAGTVTTRVLHAGVTQMDHGPATGVTSDPAPQLSLQINGSPAADGFGGSLEVENFTFFRGAEDAAHVSGQGHAHLYLNGLKLGRLYEPTFTIGALQPGAYVLEVSLNTNDHRAYLDASGAAVVAQLAFDIPE